MANHFETEYLGARATPGLVNRISILNQIKQAIEDRSRSYIIYITAPGGFGKTFLLREVLRRCRDGGEWFTPEASIITAGDVVDLYHAHTHSIEGLTRTWWNNLGPVQADMASYEEALSRFERERLDLTGVHMSALRDEVARAFLSDLNRLAKTRRLVLALDTAEKLLYEMDRVQQALGLGEAGIAVLPWLLQEFLPKLENAVILIAGRPRPERLRADLRKALPGRLVEYELPGFEDKEDVIAYFEAVAEAVRQAGNDQIAARIAAVPEDTREVFWRYTGGRPILLSLLIDYLVVANELLPAVKVPVEKARGKSQDELEEIEQNIEAEVVRLFQNTGRPADEAIRDLAWTRKGMDAEMLAYIADMDVPEAARTLAELRDLSFVKVRPADDRVFLHDEMYEMLHRHVLVRLPKARQKKIYSAIVNYYAAELIPQIRQQLERLERQRQQEILSRGQVTTIVQPDVSSEIAALANTRQELEHAIVEEVYYRLRQDPLSGFQTYVEYAEEAILAGDVSRDMLLRDELLEFLADPKYKDAWQVGALSRSAVEWDAGIRWVRRLIFYSGNFEQALTTANQLREQFGDLMQEVGSIAEAELTVLEAWALSYQSRDLEKGEKRLHKAIETLQRFDQLEDSIQSQRRNILLAQAYNILGYLYRMRGQFQRATGAYQQALPLWRDTKFKAEHANTLNNLAWAYAESDDFSQAIRLVRNALELRGGLGPRAPVGLSLNTLGLILIRTEQPGDARVACEQALAIFRELEHRRGIGLACTALAEALRRLNNTLPELYSPERRAEMMRQAEGYAGEAVEIFSAERGQELSRRVEALIVLGSARRDWIPLRPLYENEDDPDRAKLIEGAIDALRRAGEEATDDLLYRKIEALVNLAWVYVYIGQPSQARSLIEEEVWPAILPDYHITEAGLPRPGLPVPFLWVQLAKSHTLLGHLALKDYRLADETFKETRIDEQREIAHRHLRLAAREYTLGLAYDGHYRRDIRKIGRGHDRIYNDLKILNLEELQIVIEETIRTANQYQLGEKTFMRTFLEQSFGPLYSPPQWSNLV